MDLSSYNGTAPCVSISQADGAILKAAAEEKGDYTTYYEGSLTVAEDVGTQVYHSEYYDVSDFSSWGIPGSLEMKPEITAPGGSIYSVNGAVKGGQAYETMSGTSMAAPQVAGMAALVAQYIRETGLDQKTGRSARYLAQSLLMSTAQPLLDGSTGSYWSVLQQGAGLANVGDAIAEETYDPARNALNSVNGDQLTKVGYTLIRNAAQVILSLESDGGNRWEKDIQDLDAAYYYVNGSRWMNTGYSADLLLSPTGVQEGSRYTLKLQAATEYDVREDGIVDWNALGAGSTLEIPFVIDNTAPVLTAAGLEGDQLSAESGTKTLTLSVEENQYLAAALLYTADGSICLRTIDPQQKNAGRVPDLTLTTEGLADGVYLLQLYDYAMNVSTYRLFLGQGAADTAESVTVSPAALKLLPGESQRLTASVLPLSVKDSSVTWSSSDETVAAADENGTVTAVAEGKCTITAASNLTDTVIGSCQVEVFTLSKKLNAVVWGKNEDAQWASFETARLPAYTPLTSGEQSVKPVAVTYDETGVLYAADRESDGSGATLYTVDPENGFAATEVGSTDACFFADLAQAPTLGVLIAVYGPYLVAVDPADGSVLGALELYSNAMVGIAYCGSFYSSYNKCWLDSYLLLDSAGNVYRQNLTLLNGKFSYTDDGETGLLFRADADVNAMEYFSSAYYDGEYLYWSVYDQDSNAARIFAIDVSGERCYDLGSFEENVWPVAGLFELADGSVQGDSALKGILGVEDSPLQADAFTDAMAPLAKEIPGGSLNAVSGSAAPQSASELVTGEDGSTAILQLTAKDAEGNDIASHSGKLTVSYDPAKLTLAENGVTVYAAHSGVNGSDGEITIAYADLDGFAAGQAVAALRFTVTDAEGAELTVRHLEVNDSLNGAYTYRDPPRDGGGQHPPECHPRRQGGRHLRQRGQHRVLVLCRLRQVLPGCRLHPGDRGRLGWDYPGDPGA